MANRGIRRPARPAPVSRKARVAGLTLPAGATTSSANQVAALQQMTGTAVQTQPSEPLPRDQFPAVFGPGTPLTPAALNPPRPDTGQADPRRFEYDVSWNLTNDHRLVPWRTLRESADGVDIIRRCIEVRKVEIQQLDWDITPTPRAEEAAEAATQHDKRKLRQQYAGHIDRLIDFWSTPDTGNGFTWSEWLGMLLEEHLVLDALSIYPRMTRGGALHSLEIIDGSTVKPLLDSYGNTPRHPDPAYQQWLYGFPRGEYTDTGAGDWEGTSGSLIYRPRVRRTWTPYGYSQVEQALVSADIYLRRQDWMRKEYTAGTLPTAFLKTDASIGQLTPQQYRAWNSALNDYFSGDSENRHRFRMLPAGFDPIATQDVSERYKADYDEFLVKLLCSHLDVQPEEIGFTPRQGLGGAGHAQAQEDVNYRKAIRPMCAWLVDILNHVSRSYLGMPKELTFQFLGLESEDEASADNVGMARVQSGRETLNEERDRIGLPRYDFPEADMPFVSDHRGLVFLEGASELAPAGTTVSPPQFKPSAGEQPAVAEATPGQQQVATDQQPGQPGKQPTSGQQSQATKAELAAYRKWARTSHARPFEFEHLTKADAAAAGVDVDRAVFKAGDAGPKVPGRFGWTGHDQLISQHAPALAQGFSGAIDVPGLLDDLKRERPVTRTRIADLVGRRIDVPDDSALVALYRAAWDAGLADVHGLLQKVAQADGDPSELAALIRQAAQVLTGMVGTLRRRVANLVTDTLRRGLPAPEQGSTEPEWPSADRDRPIPWPREDRDIDWPTIDRDLQHEVADVVEQHSKLAAETEATRAMTAAAYASYREFGVEWVSFITAEDDRVCVLCDANEAQGPIPISANFINGTPPVHPRCRCAVVPEWEPPPAWPTHDLDQTGPAWPQQDTDQPIAWPTRDRDTAPAGSNHG